MHWCVQCKPIDTMEDRRVGVWIQTQGLRSTSPLRRYTSTWSLEHGEWLREDIHVLPHLGYGGGAHPVCSRGMHGELMGSVVVPRYKMPMAMAIVHVHADTRSTLSLYGRVLVLHNVLGHWAHRYGWLTGSAHGPTGYLHASCPDSCRKTTSST